MDVVWRGKAGVPKTLVRKRWSMQEAVVRAVFLSLHPQRSRLFIDVAAAVTAPIQHMFFPVLLARLKSH